MEEEWKRGTNSWQEVTKRFFQCFSFEGETELVSQALQAIKGVLFLHNPAPDGGTFASLPEARHELAFQRIDGDPDDDSLEDLRHLYFEEKEGEWNINEELTIEGIHLLPLKTKKLNISTEERPKLADVGDY